MYVRSPFGADPMQICWANVDSCTWFPHDEHLTVGRKVDSRGSAMMQCKQPESSLLGVLWCIQTKLLL